MAEHNKKAMMIENQLSQVLDRSEMIVLEARDQVEQFDSYLSSICLVKGIAPPWLFPSLSLEAQFNRAEPKLEIQLPPSSVNNSSVELPLPMKISSKNICSTYKCMSPVVVPKDCEEMRMDGSLKRLQRSKSRQKALINRSSAKAKKPCNNLNISETKTEPQSCSIKYISSNELKLINLVGRTGNLCASESANETLSSVLFKSSYDVGDERNNNDAVNPVSSNLSSLPLKSSIASSVLRDVQMNVESKVEEIPSSGQCLNSFDEDITLGHRCVNDEIQNWSIDLNKSCRPKYDHSELPMKGVEIGSHSSSNEHSRNLTIEKGEAFTEEKKHSCERHQKDEAKDLKNQVENKIRVHSNLSESYDSGFRSISTNGRTLSPQMLEFDHQMIEATEPEAESECILKDSAPTTLKSLEDNEKAYPDEEMPLSGEKYHSQKRSATHELDEGLKETFPTSCVTPDQLLITRKNEAFNDVTSIQQKQASNDICRTEESQTELIREAYSNNELSATSNFSEIKASNISEELLLPEECLSQKAQQRSTKLRDKENFKASLSADRHINEEMYSPKHRAEEYSRACYPISDQAKDFNTYEVANEPFEPERNNDKFSTHESPSTSEFNNDEENNVPKGELFYEELQQSSRNNIVEDFNASFPLADGWCMINAEGIETRYKENLTPTPMFYSASDSSKKPNDFYQTSEFSEKISIDPAINAENFLARKVAGSIPETTKHQENDSSTHVNQFEEQLNTTDSNSFAFRPSLSDLEQVDLERSKKSNTLQFKLTSAYRFYIENSDPQKQLNQISPKTFAESLQNSYSPRPWDTMGSKSSTSGRCNKSLSELPRINEDNELSEDITSMLDIPLQEPKKKCKDSLKPKSSKHKLSRKVERTPLSTNTKATSVASGKREVKVKALEAAVTAKIAAEKRELERKMKREAFKKEKENKKMIVGKKRERDHEDYKETNVKKLAKKKSEQIVEVAKQCVKTKMLDERTLKVVHTLDRPKCVFQSYVISPYKDSDGESDEESAKRSSKFVPHWANQVAPQSNIDPYSIFGARKSCSLSKVFGR